MLNTISSFSVLYFMYFLHLLLLQHGDIERNPGPQSGQIKNLSCCHWNVNSLIAQNLSKITQLEAYNSLYKHDFICIFETCVDSSILLIIQVIQKEVVFLFTTKNRSVFEH